MKSLGRRARTTREMRRRRRNRYVMSNIEIQSELYIFQKVSKKLSDLVNYIHAVHFPGFDNTSAK